MILVSKKDYEVLEKFKAEKLKEEESIKKWAEDQKERRAKYNYARGFFKGFDLNRIDEDLACVYILYGYDDIRGYYPLDISQSERPRSQVKAKLSGDNNIKKIHIIPVGKAILKDMSKKATRSYIRDIIKVLLEDKTEKIELYPNKLGINSYNVDSFTWEQLKADDL
ncbi:hypothetical protein [Peribacillus simplex]|uniref:hypothetical protein n=1 Tax=Peribacillus simplex TaxID=1478 RepID=UPI003D01E3C4